MFDDMKYVSGSSFVEQASRSVNLINLFIKAIFICFILLIGSMKYLCDLWSRRNIFLMGIFVHVL